jgi:hypothetical protein
MKCRGKNFRACNPYAVEFEVCKTAKNVSANQMHKFAPPSDTGSAISQGVGVLPKQPMAASLRADTLKLLAQLQGTGSGLSQGRLAVLSGRDKQVGKGVSNLAAFTGKRSTQLTGCIAM